MPVASHIGGYAAPWLGSATSGTPSPAPSHHSGNLPLVIWVAAAIRGGAISVW